MNEREVQLAIFNKYSKSNRIIMPNYTPIGWWECDVCCLTKAGYMREWEVKLSASDFRADFKKGKHKLMAEESDRCPRQFWFVMKEGLVPISDIPDYSGLIYIEERVHSYFDGDHRWLNLNEVKKAPFLNKNKETCDIEQHMRSVASYRYWNQLEINVQLTKQIEEINIKK